jgi:hypothetical protein
LEEVENFISRVKVDAEVERSRLASLWRITYKLRLANLKQ